MLLSFDPFRIDLIDERLWRDAEPIHLTRKAWGVLRVLVESNGRLVTKEQLVQTVWSDTAVGDDSLTKAVLELRRALGDDQRAPRFIATVHGRGYRFVAPLGSSAAHVATPATQDGTPLIGREHELRTLQAWLDEARRGRRQVGIVSGDVGIGKSRLVAAFIDGAQQAAGSMLHVAIGRCVEQYGRTEPFLPVIEALRRLARVPSVAAMMRSAAPPWLSAACGLVPRSETAEKSIGTRASVLRILAEVIEAISNETPVALLLKDLHWSDPSTLDLINLLARRTDPARLFVLCTVRYGAALGAGHPSALLVRELRRTELCREIVLAPFAPRDVERYLAARLEEDPPATATAYLRRHSGGNPFFLRALVDDLVARRALRCGGNTWDLVTAAPPAIPSGSLAALAPRLERLSDSERTMLETASVIGDVFAAETIAAASADGPDAATALERIEAECDRLVRHQDILRAGDGGTPYAFQHALYRQALYDGIPPARRRRLHRLVAESLLRDRPADSTDGAAQLAEHFARAGEHAQAVTYHAEAALAARKRCADREVAAQLATALEHLHQCPPSNDRDLQELMLLQQHATAVSAVVGFGDPAIGEACRRAQVIARRLDIPPAIFITTAALTFLHIMRAELDDAARLAEELLAAAPALPFPECGAAANAAIAVVEFHRGDPLSAKRRLEASFHPLPRESPGFAFDGAVWQLAFHAAVHADLGEARAARAKIAEILAIAGDSPATQRATALLLAARVEARLRNAPLVLQYVDTALALPVDDGPSLFLAAGSQLRGWALSALGDRAGARAAYGDRGASWRAIGQRIDTPFMAMLRTEAALCDNDVLTARASINAGLEHAAATGEHRLDGELHRLLAECLRRGGKIDKAATEIATALAISAAQGARLAELRAAMDNVALRRSGKGYAAAAERLAAVVASLDASEPLPELALASNLLRGDFSAA